MGPAAQWRIDAADFPADGGDDAKLAFLVRYATLAPSGHNTQPWRFRIDGDRLLLFADRSRSLPVVDPQDRALTISNGAAVGMLRAAMRAFGNAGEIALIPDPDDADFLAAIRLGMPHQPSDRDRARFDAITHRRTTRRDFSADPLPTDLIERLSDLDEASARVTILADSATKASLGDLVAEGDQAQFADPAFRRELAAWVRSRRAGSRDGMSGANFGFPDFASPVGGAVIRLVDMGKAVGAADQKRVASAPALALVTTPADSPRDWLNAGMVHVNMWLDITAAGFTAAYCNQPIETPELRPSLAEVANTIAVPQLLLRLGKGPTVSPAVRRAVEEVLDRSN